jgi:hypothetical protein
MPGGDGILRKPRERKARSGVLPRQRTNRGAACAADQCAGKQTAAGERTDGDAGTGTDGPAAQGSLFLAVHVRAAAYTEHNHKKSRDDAILHDQYSQFEARRSRLARLHAAALNNSCAKKFSNRPILL